MATMQGLPKDLRDFLSTYPWHQVDPVPWAEMETPLEEARVGLVVMACMTNPGDPPFHGDAPENDPSIRVVNSDSDPQALVNTYPGQAFNHAGLRADANLLIPLDRLRDMVADGEIGEIAPRTVSLCGHLPKPQKLIDFTAPEIARLFISDGVDVVLLVPA